MEYNLRLIEPGRLSPHCTTFLMSRVTLDFVFQSSDISRVVKKLGVHPNSLRNLEKRA